MSAERSAAPNFTWEQPSIIELAGICPECHRLYPLEIEEDNAGRFHVPDSERFVLCECGEQIDFGAVISIGKPRDATT